MTKMMYLDAVNNDDSTSCYAEYSHYGTSDGHMTRVTGLDGNTIDPSSFTTFDPAEPQPEWAVDDSDWVDPTDPGPVPGSITKYQLLMQLRAMDAISVGEALMAARGGDVPLVIMQSLMALSQTDRENAQVQWAVMTEVRRDNYFVTLIEAAAGMGSGATDDFFRAAALITV